MLLWTRLNSLDIEKKLALLLNLETSQKLFPFFFMVWLRTNSGARDSIFISFGLPVSAKGCMFFKKTFFRLFSTLFSVPNESVACMDSFTKFLTIDRTFHILPHSCIIASAVTNGHVILKAGSVVECCKFEFWFWSDDNCCWIVVDCCCLDYGGTILP